MIPALLTTVLFALTAVCATQASRIFGPERANLGRLLVALLILGAWSHVFGAGWGGGQAVRFLLAGALGFGLGGWCMFRAFPLLGSTLSLLGVECAAAFVTLLLAAVVLGAGISLFQGACVLLTLGGLLVALGPFPVPRSTARRLAKGILLTTLAASCQSCSWILSKQAFVEIQLAGTRFDPLSAAYQRLAGGFLVALVVGLLAHGCPSRKGTASVSRRPPGRDWKPVLWIVGNALAGPVLGVSSMLWAIREVENPGLVQTVVATATLFTVPLARQLEQRRFGWPYFLGFALSFAGVAGLLFTSKSGI